MTAPAPGVAIVGIGALFPGAASAAQFWDNIVGGVDAISDAPPERWDPVFFDLEATATGDRFYCRRGGFVDDLADFDPTAFGVMPLAVDGAEPDQLLALATAAAALRDAGHPEERCDLRRVGVVLGRGGYVTAGIERLEQRVYMAEQLAAALRALVPDLSPKQIDEVRHEFQERVGPARPEASIGLVPNLAASRIANRLDLQGPAFTVDAACASALVAVDHAMRELESGRCDLMLAGGVHHCHGLTIWSVFTQLGALSRRQSIQPFSRHADGLLIGEGTGIFVLKRLADAERDDDRIYAVLRGAGVASDGRSSSLMSPRVDGQTLALRQAWSASGLDPATVGLIEAHGTATPSGDDAELASLRSFFGDAPAGTARAGLGSVKSMIGHAMPAAGAAGLAKAALAVHHGVLPPTLHADEPHPGVADTMFRLIGAPEPWAGDGPRRAGVNAFGFGGINCHLVLEQHGAGTRRRAGSPARRAADAPTAVPGASDPSAVREPVLRLAGADAAELAARYAALPRDDAGLLAPAAYTADIGEGPCRLAVVAPNARRIELVRRILGKGAPWRGLNDIWFEPEGLLHAGGTLAFVFPGVEPTFEPHVDDIEAHFGVRFRGAPEGAPPLEVQSRGIVAVGRLLDHALRATGVTPDLIFGHSLGEWCGEIASETIRPDRVDAFLDTLHPGHLRTPNVIFAAAGCGIDEARAAIDGLTDIAVSHDNCVHQTVLCGSHDPITVATERLKAAGVSVQQMPFESGFHSPLFEPYLGPILEHLDDLAIQAPRIPLWSATTCAPYPDDPDEIRALTVRHLLEPVRFRELTETLYDGGVRVFVQVGYGSANGFIDDTLGPRPKLTVAAASAKHPGLAQLRRAVAAAWVEGAPAHPELLDADLHPAAAPADAPATDAPVVGVAEAPGPDRPATAHTVRLRLGTTLVHDLSPLELDTIGGSAVPPSVAAAAASGDPVLAEIAALLGETSSAATEVLESWSPVRPGRPATPAAAPVAEAADGLDELRTFSVEQEPAWYDHAFIRQPEGWPYPDDRFPLVPMTGILQLFCDTAERVAGPGAVAVAIEDVRAFRWLEVDPPREVRLRAQPIDGDRTRWKVSLEGHARATVVVAPAYPEQPARPTAALVGERPAAISGPELYSQRWMFHGPAYQGVRSFAGIGVDGIRGTVETLPAPGALLDNAGQLVGYWVSATNEVDRLVLPTSIDRITFHGPHPAPGALVEVDVHITSLTDEAVRADIVLAQGDQVWVQVEGWQERRFETDDRVWQCLLWSEQTLVADLDPAGFAVADERWRDTATRDMIMRRYLQRPERQVYLTKNPKAQRQWLLGRIAAKDLVRRWLWDAGHGPLQPGEILVTNDERGRPVVSGPFPDDLRVSIAHTDGIGVAIVAEGAAPGIDIERVEPRSEQFEAITLTDREQGLRSVDGDDRDQWLTRLWAAKEAAGKAAGTGLQGRPKDLEVDRVEGSRLRVAGRWIDTDRLERADAMFVVAWTEPEAR